MINLKRREASKIVAKLRDGRLVAVQYKEMEDEDRARKHFVSKQTIANGSEDGVALLRNYNSDLTHKTKPRYDIMAYAQFNSQQEAISLVVDNYEPDWDWKRNPNQKLIDELKATIRALEED